MTMHEDYDLEAKTKEITNLLPPDCSYDYQTNMVSIPYDKYKALVKKANAFTINPDHKNLISLIITIYRRALSFLSFSALIAVMISIVAGWPWIPSLISYLILGITFILPSDQKKLEKLLIDAIKKDNM